MTFRKLARRAIFSLSLIVLLILGSQVPADAETAIDSIDMIQSVLPDSVSLEGKVVYVDFWASWCVPCRLSFPWMSDLYDQYHREDFEIIAVNVDKDHRAALDFLKANPAGFHIIYDSSGVLAKQYELDAMPLSFLYDRDGKLVSRHRGFQQDEAVDMKEKIVTLIRDGGINEQD